MSRFRDEFRDYLGPIREDIHKFCSAMRFDPTWQQDQLFNLLQKEQRQPIAQRLGRFAIRSGQGPGKTTAIAVAGMWLAIQAKDTLGVLSAPSMRQCKDAFMAEAERLTQKADPWLRAMFDVTATKITICGRRNWAIKTATAVRAENLQGYHQENLFFLLDESSGIKREIIETVKGTVSNQGAIVIAIGNPNKRDSAFFDFFYKSSEAKLWHKMHWDAEDTARDYPMILAPRRNFLLEQEFGRDSDVYRIRVRGEFPHTDPNCVIALEDLEACAENDMLTCAKDNTNIQVPKAISYDFARFGGDENVVMQRSGCAIIDWQRFPRGTTDPSEAVRQGFRLQHNMGWTNHECWHIPDATGMGEGLMHLFYEAKKQVHEFKFHMKASDPQYKDKATEAWFNVRHLTRGRLISVPNDGELFHQLTTRQYYPNKDGQLVIESKEDYLKRGNDLSPDRADALVLAFYDKMMSGGRAASRSEGGRASRRVGSKLRRVT